MVLGLGKAGHLGFNEPRTSAKSTTRLIILDRFSRCDVAADFINMDNVPRQVLSMGI